MASSQPLFLPEASDSDTAWLFPGQGAQEVGMGKDLWQDSPAARQVFDTADETLGYKLSDICFDGPDEKLRDTGYAQPAIFTASLASLAAAIESGRVTARPAFMAGHSMGEYSALVASGALSLEDGIRLIAERGRLMSEAGKKQVGTLAAVLGLDEDTVRAVCKEADVDLCNLNLPTQTVIGGLVPNVQRAIALAKEKGAQRAIELNVSGAFHSRLMQPAIPGMKKALARARIAPSAVPVIANMTVAPLNDATDVRNELETQIASPVRWHESVTLMAASGVIAFIEFGPGRVLTGMVRRLTPGAKLVNIGSMADLQTS